MNKSTGTFLFETPLLFLFKQMLHVEVAFLSPVCSGHITKSGTDGHQGTLTIRENADGPGSSLNLTIYPFNEVGRSDLIPMLVRKVHVGQSFINPGFYLFCGSSEFHFPKLLHHSLCFYTSGSLVFPGVDSLEHPCLLPISFHVGWRKIHCRKSVPCNTVSDKIFKIVLYKNFIQLYNGIRHSFLPPWDIGYGDLMYRGQRPMSI